MTYATLQNLTDRFGEGRIIDLTDRGEEPTGAIVTAVTDRALAATDAQINGFLKDRYVLPLSETPPLLAELAEVIALWKLYPYAPDEKVKKDYDDALKMLRDIADGRVKLDIAGIEPEGAEAGGVRITDRERPLTETNLKGFI